MPTHTLCPRLTDPAVSDHVIVARCYAEWCEALREAIAARGNYTIIVNRRLADRRRGVQPVQDERRRGERRCCPAIMTDPHRWPYVLVGQNYRPPRN